MWFSIRIYVGKLSSCAVDPHLSAVACFYFRPLKPCTILRGWRIKTEGPCVAIEPPMISLLPPIQQDCVILMCTVGGAS